VGQVLGEGRIARVVDELGEGLAPAGLEQVGNYYVYLLFINVLSYLCLKMVVGHKSQWRREGGPEC
jgi:hypothetical protein